MRAFYNEIDRYCCDWLQNLMDAGHITPGKIDDRSIADLSPDDVSGYERCHFFAGIAGWELALSLSGYSGPVWTGSCPCQPFSAAGKGKASSDERHLWPVWFELIRAVRPPVIFGEQVEAAIGWGWLDLVCSDLEKEGYTVGAAVLPACSVGAPHIRQRLWFMADTMRGRTDDAPGQGLGAQAEIDGEDGSLSRERLRPRVQGAVGELADAGHASGWPNNPSRRTGGRDALRERSEGSTELGANCGLGNTDRGRCEQRDAGERVLSESGEAIAESCHGGISISERRQDQAISKSRGSSAVDELADTKQWGRQSGGQLRSAASSASESSPLHLADHPWSNLIWIPCTDGKQRPTQSGIFPLAHGIPARVAKLRAAGNAITPQCAAEFIKATMSA